MNSISTPVYKSVFFVALFIAVFAVPLLAHAGGGPRGFTPGTGSSEGGDSIVTTGTIGGSGGSSFTRQCPTGSAMTGIHGRAARYVDQVVPICTSGSAGGIGGGGGSPFSLDCPSGQTVMGIYGGAGVFVDRLGLSCAPSGAKTTTVGGSGGSAYSLQCPTGYTAVGLYGRAARFLDQVGVVCQNSSTVDRACGVPIETVHTQTFNILSGEGMSEIAQDTQANGGFNAAAYPGRPFNDAATRARVCELLMPGSVPMANQQGSYYSPGDNYIYHWDGSLWHLYSAAGWELNNLGEASGPLRLNSGNNRRIDSITCGVTSVTPGPECPIDDDDVDSCTNLDGVQTSIPVGFVAQGDQCVFDGCPTGYSYRDGQCSLDCPAGYLALNTQCVQQCPAGYTVYNNQCVTTRSTTGGHYCSAGNLYYRSATGEVSLVQTCSFGCAGTSCIDPLAISSISAKPSLVRQGGSTKVTWLLDTVADIACSVTGTNGDSWSGKSGTKTSGAIEGETTYTLTCNGQDLKSVTVRVIPSWQER